MSVSGRALTGWKKKADPVTSASKEVKKEPKDASLAPDTIQLMWPFT